MILSLVLSPIATKLVEKEKENTVDNLRNKEDKEVEERGIRIFDASLLPDLKKHSTAVSCTVRGHISSRSRSQEETPDVSYTL